jgi:hypothetical protein
MAKKFRVRWDRIIGATLVGIIIAGLAVWGMNIATGIGPDGKWYPDCETEDSNNCYWDAHERGNGEGHSFFVIEDVVYYVD